MEYAIKIYKAVYSILGKYAFPAKKIIFHI